MGPSAALGSRYQDVLELPSRALAASPVAAARPDGSYVLPALGSSLIATGAVGFVLLGLVVVVGVDGVERGADVAGVLVLGVAAGLAGVAGAALAVAGLGALTVGSGAFLAAPGGAVVGAGVAAGGVVAGGAACATWAGGAVATAGLRLSLDRAAKLAAAAPSTSSAVSTAIVENARQPVRSPRRPGAAAPQFRHQSCSGAISAPQVPHTSAPAGGCASGASGGVGAAAS